jgi:FKBP-type peptidyl-prolyl cis-trans isomerase FklB
MFRPVFAALALGTLMIPSISAGQENAPRGQAKPELKSVTQQASYAIGMNFGQQIAEAELDTEALIAGIRDSLSKAEPQLTDEQLNEAMAAFGKQMQAKAAAKAAQASKAGDDFLAANAKKQGVKTTKSGLQYRVIKAGDGPSPKADSVVKVHYHGTLPDGRVFDSSVERKEPAEFPVNRVIPGWTEALQLMKVGDKVQLVIPPNLAYGDRGAGPLIGPNQVLVFDVELLDIVK